MKHVDVVIISWAKDEELLKVTRNGLDSLFGSEPNGDIIFHAYVVESNPDVNYDEYNKTYRRHTTTTLRPIGEFGYHKYLNLGRKAGDSEFVVLCNSDLTYENNWASEMVKIMELFPDLKSASPWCPQTQGDNTPAIGYLIEGRRVRGELAGWCIFQRRDIYDTIGDLDENFTHWYCDNDYGMTMEKHNIRHFLVPTSVVNHHGEDLGVTHKKFDKAYQIQTTNAQQAKFQNKWNVPHGPLK